MATRKTTGRASKETKAVELYKNGVKTAEISERTGVSRPRLYALLAREGVVPSRTRRLDVGEVVTATQLLQMNRELAEENGHLRSELEHTRAELAVLTGDGVDNGTGARRRRSRV